MHNHPFAEQRFAQAHHNLSSIKKVLETGDLENFIKIVESEALTLHAMMMTSMPYFILMKPNSNILMLSKTRLTKAARIGCKT
jgi:diphosphomevalonate decarboxylase